MTKALTAAKAANSFWTALGSAGKALVMSKAFLVASLLGVSSILAFEELGPQDPLSPELLNAQGGAGGGDDPGADPGLALGSGEDDDVDSLLGDLRGRQKAWTPKQGTGGDKDADGGAGGSGGGGSDPTDPGNETGGGSPGGGDPEEPDDEPQLPSPLSRLLENLTREGAPATIP